MKRIALIAVLLLPATAVLAVERLVPGQYPTIQAAIDDCNDGDTVIVAPVTYTGEGNRDIDFKGKAITVRSIDPNDPNIVAATVIDCNGSPEEPHRGFIFQNGEDTNSVLTGLTITNGYMEEGGGIFCDLYSSPTITNCTIRGNISDEGGGIYCYYHSDPRIKNCSINGNTSDEAGAIYCYKSSPMIINCTITDNIADTGSGVYCNGSYARISNCSIMANIARAGGAIYNDGSSITITDCTICNNMADYGGGIYSSQSNSNISNCTITQNMADGGGGICCGYISNPTITNCTITQNIAEDGGGIHCYRSNPTITNCTITQNITEEEGGIYCYRSNPIITNCTLMGNTANEGGGIYCDQSNPEIANSSIISNSASQSGGGICCDDHSNLTITNCMIVGNTSMNGGGIYCRYSSNPRITNSFIFNNRANYGGAISCHSSNQTIANCIITGNTASLSGGAIYCYKGDAMFNNCSIIGNIASEDGGGIYSYIQTNLKIVNCSINSNSAEQGGGLFVSKSSESSITNCILWANADSNGTGQSAQIYCNESNVTYSCIQDDNPDDANIPFDGADSNNIDDNPMFVRDPNDGGDGWGDNPETPDINEAVNDDFGDLHLQPNSHCINTGDPLTWAGPHSVDMDGQWRIMGHIIDMGVDEFLIPMIITTRPQGGEVWVSGSQHKITWDSCASIETVDILFSKDAGGNWQTIESNIPDTGSFKCQMPDIVDSNQCLILIVPNVPDPNVLCIESGLFTVHPDSPGPAVQSKWKSLGGDFDRSGLSQDSGPELGCVKWQFQTDGPVTASAAVGADGKVAIACEDGKLYTLDSNGTLLWSYDTNSPLISSPSIGLDGTIYIGAKNGKLYAIDINGNLRWTQPTDAWIYSSPAVSEDGVVFVGSQDGTLYAFGRDGSELWNFQTCGDVKLSGAILASPSIAPDGTIYTAGLYDPNLYALDPNDGSIKWVCNFQLPIDPHYPFSELKSGWPFASPVIAPDGTIYQILLYDTYLYAIEPNDGNIIWSTNLADPDSGWFDPEYPYRYMNVEGWSEPTLGPDGTIYVSFDDPYLRALDPNGSIKWVTRLGMVGGFTLTVGNNGLIYAAGDDAHLYVVDTNGSEIARFRSDDWLSFPVITADNTIIVSDTNNTVWALGGEGCEGKSSALHRPGDLNADWKINFRDFALLARDWLDCTERGIWPWFYYDYYFFYHGRWWRVIPSPPCNYNGENVYLGGDINRNFYIDFADIAEFANRWLSEEQ